MEIKELKQYTLVEEKKLNDLNSQGYLLKHNKSGARILLISNDDENKVFSIGFRTPPTDSTGVPHILEHSVLCGSEKFPAKDPFVELVKGSLNTFLNAMTYPDKTVYPVASCNDKDFQNLMDVYMDAVFNTNIYKHEEIFKQEGWHYEIDNPDDELKISGVVYNEMKGAFSSPEGVLEREIINSLFPDTTYHYESGGDPLYIPNLRYEDFLNFHKKYYHPSNSYIYLYGDMDMVEKLEWLDKEYLSKYDEIIIDSAIELQKPFDKPSEVKLDYSITMEEELEDNTYLSYNKVIDTSFDKELCMAFNIIDYALLGAPGAPLKQALIDEKIGKDIMSSFDDGLLQPVFSIIAKNSNYECKDKFIEIIDRVLNEQVKNGINKKSLLAAVNIFEFKHREADFGNYPKGLMYGLQTFDSWLYDDNKPFLHLEYNEVFASLREKINTDYFEKIIEKYLLNNNHASIVSILPKRGLTAQNDAKLAKKLAEYKAGLSKEEIDKLVKDTHDLKKYQEEPSTKEELEKIPLLAREDIKKQAAPFITKEHVIDDTVVLHQNVFTNGIGYLNLIFRVKDMPAKLIPYMSILKSVLGYVDTKNYSFQELTNEININSGGIAGKVLISQNFKDTDDYILGLEIRASVLYDKLDFAFDIIKEIITSSRIDDEKRLYEIIAEKKSKLQMVMNSSGHTVATARAASYFSKLNKISDMTGGIDFYRIIDDLEKNFDSRKKELIDNLKLVLKYVFRPENLLVSYTANDDGFKQIEDKIPPLKACLYTDSIDTEETIIECTKKNEGFKAASKVQYVARAGEFNSAGFEYTGALRILRVILSYDYLWLNVRVQGGAYGCMSGFTRAGYCYFASYRDPHLKNTNDVYNKIPEYLRNLELDERDMTKYIIGTISGMDTPLTPMAKGERSLSAYLSNLDFEEVQRERDQVLNANQDDIRKLADIVEAVLKCDNLCVIGSEEKINDNKDMFMEIKNLN